MTTAEVAAQLAAYHAELIGAGVPEPVANAVVLDLAQRLHAGTTPFAQPTGPTADDVAAAAEAKRENRARRLREAGVAP